MGEYLAQVHSVAVGPVRLEAQVLIEPVRRYARGVRGKLDMIRVQVPRRFDKGRHQLPSITPAPVGGTDHDGLDIGNGKFQHMLDAERSGGDDIPAVPNHEDAGVFIGKRLSEPPLRATARSR